MPHITGWDYLTFVSIFITGVAGLALVVFILGLPGRIAYARKHPEADAVNIMGWLGFLGVVPWVQAFIWAFKPTDAVDIRRFPSEERQAIAEEMRKHEDAGKGSIATQHGTEPETPKEQS